ncbi:PilZ domain-containing protein [Desulfobulbus sp. AH-315-M07]|nr:PilZ domain-containing protein [Desulfobulbus sp. AH-315-M07]
MENRRRHERFELMAQVRATRGRVDYILELTNISLSGVLLHLGTLETPPWVGKDRMVEVSVINPKDLESVDLRGRIMRVAADDEGGISFAIQFEGLDAQATAGLERLIAVAQRTDAPTPKASGDDDSPADSKKGPPPLPK